MKCTAIAVAVVAALTLVAASAAAGVAKGDRASEFGVVKDKSGKRLLLKQFRGQVVVITFGASWCKPCRKELPAYDKLAQTYKTKGAKVAFIAVNIDSQRPKADRFISDTNVKHMRVGYDPSGGAVERYEPATMPTTYVVDGKGIVREVHNGYVKGDEKKIARVVDSLLGTL